MRIIIEIIQKISQLYLDTQTNIDKDIHEKVNKILCQF